MDENGILLNDLMAVIDTAELSDSSAACTNSGKKSGRPAFPIDLRYIHLQFSSVHALYSSIILVL